MSRWQPIEPGARVLPEQRAIHHYRTEPKTKEDSEDGVYDVRVPTSARRYHTLEPVNLVVHDRRKTQQQIRTTQQASLQQIPLQAQEKPRLHVLAYIGAGMVLMCALWIAGSALVAWWGVHQYDQHYASTPTFQLGGVVR